MGANSKFSEGFYQLVFFKGSCIVADPQHLKEFYDAREDDLSFATVLNDILQLRYTFGENIAVNQYHTIITRAELAKHISELMPGLVDELGAALKDEIVLKDGIALS